MNRGTYRVLMGLLQAPMMLKLLWRSRKEPLYRSEMGERLGHYNAPPADPRPPTLWLHAVSLGETHACAPLLAALRATLPNLRLVLTHSTATGRQAGALLLKPGDVQAWAPWDRPAAVKRFLDHFQPDVGLLMETEVWPEWTALCAERQLPLVLVNARMSERTLQRTLRWGMPLMGETYRQLAGVLPQSQADNLRFAQLGAHLATPTGNLKFDAPIDTALQDLGRQWRKRCRQPVLMLASAREGEEDLLLDALLAHPEAQAVQWLLVPRHPQRFEEVAQRVQQKGFQVARRSQWGHAGPENLESTEPQQLGPPNLPTIWLGDSLGEMPLYYSLADCALMGGTFLPYGGQNLIEACHYACPVVLGPSTFNFALAAEQALASQAAHQVPSMAQAVAHALALVQNPIDLRQHGQQALQFAQQHRGAANRTVQALADYWPTLRGT